MSPRAKETVPPTSSRGVPSALFPETAFDFGKIAPDWEFEHTFTVMNVGTGDLVVRKVVVG